MKLNFPFFVINLITITITPIKCFDIYNLFGTKKDNTKQETKNAKNTNSSSSKATFIDKNNDIACKEYLCDYSSKRSNDKSGLWCVSNPSECPCRDGQYKCILRDGHNFCTPTKEECLLFS